MTSRPEASNDAKRMIGLIEQRYDVRLEASSADHLNTVQQHYREKRDLLLAEHGQVATLTHPDYAKAVLISEAARMILREIDPRPRKRKKRKKDNT